MKKIWSKKRFQRTGHPTRPFGRFTHVFRSCRKQSYDSENTEDENAEPQMETKQGNQGKDGWRRPPDDGSRMMEYNPDPSDRRATLPGSYDPVIERELRALGARPPGAHMEPPNPSRQALSGGPSDGGPPVRHLGVEPLIRASHANLARPVQGSEESVSVGSDYYGSMFSLYRGRTLSMPL
ncbi:striated muscle-specific serine/threonine-protein kinase-like isoform 2-T2 [Synchiropus picturatus]